MKQCETCGCPDAKWLTVETVARHFGCTPKKIRRLIRSGELEGVRLGRNWRVDHRSVDRLVRSHSLEGEGADSQ